MFCVWPLCCIATSLQSTDDKWNVFVKVNTFPGELIEELNFVVGNIAA